MARVTEYPSGEEIRQAPGGAGAAPARILVWYLLLLGVQVGAGSYVHNGKKLW
jgi:hypothetical protein